METDNNAVEDFPEFTVLELFINSAKPKLKKKETQGKKFSVINISYTVMVM